MLAEIDVEGEEAEGDDDADGRETRHDDVEVGLDSHVYLSDLLVRVVEWGAAASCGHELDKRHSVIIVAIYKFILYANAE